MIEQSLPDGVDIRRDPRTGRPSKVMGEFDMPVGDSMEDSVRGFLQANDERLQLGGVAATLDVVKSVSTPARRIVIMQQKHQGLPILDHTVTVQVDTSNRVRQVDLAHVPNPTVAEAQGDEKKLTPAQAVKVATDALGSHTQRAKPDRPKEVYFAARDGLRRAYVVLVPTVDPPHDWRIVVDAMTGDVLEQRDIAFRLPDGQGLVFDPNPVVTANNNTFRDSTATVASCGFAGTAQATIDAQRVTRTLRDLTLAGGVHKLDGPFAKIRNFGNPVTVIPEEATANAFNYPSNNERFEAVNVYYHLDTIQRWIQSALGITNAHNSQIEADPHEGSGGAWFSPIDGGLHFGNSGTCQPDRAEDGDVMLHEYGHAIQNDQVPGWGVTNPITGREETRAMGEGFGDILATVFFSDFGGGFQRQTFEDWIFSINGIGGLRRVDGTKVYPGDWAFEEHDDGEIWAAALWNIFRTIGGDSMNAADRETARKTLLKTLITSHFSVAANATMPDGAEAFMTTNAELPDYLGRQLMQSLDSFHARGLLPCSSSADLYIRDAADDTGVDPYVGATFWNSPDLWVRNSDDGLTVHQEPEFGQDNFIYVRVRNRGTATARAFVVTFNVKPWAGVEFTYPSDFIPYVCGTVGFNLAPGASTVVKARWPAAAVPAIGTHACLLASVYTPTDTTPAGQHVWDRNNLAQKNMTIVNLIPGDSSVVSFQLGSLVRLEPELVRLEIRRPAGWPTIPVTILHRDPKVVRALHGALSQVALEPTQARPVAVSPSVRFLESVAVEIAAGRTGGAPIRLRLAPDSRLDLGATEVSPGGANPHNLGTRDADLVSDADGQPALTFRRGTLVGLPVLLGPRSPLTLGLKITAPAESKPGDEFLIHLVERNRAGQVIGGISVQVNVVAG